MVFRILPFFILSPYKKSELQGVKNYELRKYENLL